MTDAFTKFYKKIGNNGNDLDYELIGTIGIDGVPLGIMQGASSSSDGEIGLVLKPLTGEENYIFTGNGSWESMKNIFKNEGLENSIESQESVVM